MEVIHLTPQLWQTVQINELATALIAFQVDFNKTGLKKDSKNPHLKNEYVSLDNLIHTIRPILSKNNLAITQELAGEFLITTIYHSKGQFKGSAMPFYPMAGNRGTNDLQNIGGGITYAKRYALSAILGITVDIDDDGNSAPKKDNRKDVPKDKVKEVIEWASKHGYDIKQVEQVYKLTPSQKTTIIKAFKGK